MNEWMNERYYPWQFGYQVFNNGFAINLSTIPIVLKKTQTNKQTLYHLSIILLLQDLLQVSGIIDPPKVYKAFFFF
jgi:hypothetical protein